MWTVCCLVCENNLSPPDIYCANVTELCRYANYTVHTARAEKRCVYICLLSSTCVQVHHLIWSIQNKGCVGALEAPER